MDRVGSFVRGDHSMRRISLDDPRFYFNRHLSWMQFNRRVLEEALDPSNPLLERAKFLAITASNLDEFVEIRLAGLLQQAEQGRGRARPRWPVPARGGRAPLRTSIRTFANDQYACWGKSSCPRPGRAVHPRSKVRRTFSRSEESRYAILFRESGAAANPRHHGPRPPLSARAK